jgi:hypothetical protein
MLRKTPLALTVLTALLIGSVVFAASSPSDVDGASRVVNRLDALVQPRFQLSMGEFGIDRVASSLQGHPKVGLMADETSSEQRQERVIEHMGRPFILAMLHCAHRPGRFNSDRSTELDLTSDHGTTLIDCESSSDAAAINDYNWADNHLDKVTAPYLGQVKHGQAVEVVVGKWLLAIRPVKATHQSCVTCHSGQKLGGTLGALVYMVHLKPAANDVDHDWSGGGV